MHMLIKAIGVAAVVTAFCAQMSRLPDSAPAEARLQSFYVAGYENGDWVIVDVEPASAVDSRVRFIRAYPACGTYHVQETDYVFENVSVSALAGTADLCVGEKRAAELVANTRIKRRKNEPENNYMRQGVVAQCGTEKIVYHLPDGNTFHFVIAQIKAPTTAALWNLSRDIRTRYREITKREVFPMSYDAGWEETRLANRHLAEEAATEIRNGDFDLALPELPANWQKDGKTKLSEVIPSPEEATGPETDSGVLENAEHLGLEKSDPVPYPVMARIAHIQGDVSMEVAIDSQSGAVISSTASTGHPILRVAAKDAAAKWIFQHPYFGPNPLAAKIHFEVHCPPVIETTSSHSARPVKKSKKVKKK